MTLALQFYSPMPQPGIVGRGKGGRGMGNLAGWMMFCGAIAIGVADGVYRATYGLPTLFGDDSVYTELEGVDGGGWRSTAFGYESHAPVRQMLLPVSPQQHGHGGSCEHQWQCKSHLICRDEVCSYCNSDSECQERNPERECMNQTMDDLGDVEPITMCMHKPLLSPIDYSDAFILALAFVTIFLAAPTGTGGGGILVPAFILVGQFSPHSAVPLSKACILGGALINNIFNIQRRHPFTNRPLISSELVAILVPALLGGTICGVMLNKVSPNWLIILLLVISLSITTISSFKKTVTLYREEELADASLGETTKLMSGGRHGQEAKHYSFDFENDETLTLEHREILDRESHIDMRYIGLTVCIWLVVFGAEFAKELYTECGSIPYYIVAFLPLPVVLVSVYHLGNRLCLDYKQKVAVGYRFADGDITWTKPNVRFLPAVGLLVGVAAGALGIAAGTLMGPLLLELGVLPMVGVGTSGFMVLYTSSSTTIQYILLGVLKVDYAVCLVAVSMVAAAVGNTVMYYLVKRYKKTWFVVAVLCAMIGGSTILLAVTGIYRSWAAWAMGEDMGLQPLCGHH